MILGFKTRSGSDGIGLNGLDNRLNFRLDPLITARGAEAERKILR